MAKETQLKAAPVAAAAGKAEEAFGSLLPQQTPVPAQTPLPEPMTPIPEPPQTPAPGAEVPGIEVEKAIITTKKPKDQVTTAVEEVDAMKIAKDEVTQAQKEASAKVDESANVTTDVSPPTPTVPTDGAPAPTPTPEQQALEESKQQLQQASTAFAEQQANFTSQLDQFAATLDEQSKAQVEGIKTKFDKLRKDLEQMNASVLAGKTRLGSRFGRQRFAPEIQQDILSAEMEAGIQRLADLDAQESQLILETQQANTAQQFNILLEKRAQLSEVTDRKRQEILDLNDITAKQAAIASQRAKDVRDEVTFQLDLTERFQAQEERAAGFMAPNMISIGADGRATFDPAAIQAQAELLDMDPNVLQSFVQAESERLNKLSDEERATALDLNIRQSEAQLKKMEAEFAEEFTQLDLRKARQDIALQDLKIDEAEKELSGTAAGDRLKDLSADVRKDVMAMRSIDGAVTQLTDLLQEVPTAPGTLGKAVRQYTFMGEHIGLATDTKTYNAFKDANIGLFARVISREVGVLTDKDIDRAAKILPKPGDTPKERAKKLEQLQEAIESKRTSLRDFGVEEDLLFQGEENSPVQQVTGQFEDASEFMNYGPIEDAQDFMDLLTEQGVDESSQEDVQEAFELWQSANFPQVLSTTGKGSDVTNIKDKSSVMTAIGKAVATGITSGSPAWKWGLDLVLSGGKGSPVKSPVSGEVVFVGTDSTGFGKQVKIASPSGEEWWISHLDDFNVSPGQMIVAGQSVGPQGNTGNVLGIDGRKLSKKEVDQGAGTHVDITVKKPTGGFFTSQEVASRLNTRLI